MNNVAQEYGTALFMLASEEGKIAEYREGLALIKQAFKEESEYLTFISSPGIPKIQRLSSISDAFSGKVEENMLSFLLLLCEKNRLDCFYDAEKTFEALYDESQRTLNIRVKSAVPLSDEQKARLKEKLEAKYNCKVDTEYILDTALLGGVIIEADDTVIDGSLRHRMHEIKEVIGR